MTNISIRDIMKYALATNGIIVDVRENDSFRRGHIPMAINVPLQDIIDRRVKLPKSRTLIVYCENGGASTLSARLLSDLGYNVINTVGGIRAYRGNLTRSGARY